MRFELVFFKRLLFLFFLYLPLAALAEGVLSPSVLPGYRVAISDELNFRFLYVPELNVAVTVRSDGRVSLPLVGEMLVDGLTMSELTEQVEARMAAHLRRPQVTINVQGAASVQRVFVGGEVGRPGMQPLLGSLSVLQAVMVAEGFRDTAQPRQVIVLRRGPAGTRIAVPVNLDAVLTGDDLTQDIPLQPYDVVMVPRSTIADIDRWMDLYIKRLIPVNLGFSYIINRSNGLP